MLEGYSFSYYNKPKAVTQIAELFERNNQNWSFVLGNNDGEIGGDKKTVLSAFSDYEHCLISDVGIDGVGNFNIDIVYDKNNLLHSLFMIDSRMRDNSARFIAISPSQTEWYLNKTHELKKLNVKSSMFIHIPAKEFSDAYNNGIDVEGFENHFDSKKINSNPKSSDFYKTVLDSKNNGLIATGHIHKNTCAKFYKDMYWLQLNSSRENQYKDNLYAGGVKIEIDTAQDNFKDMYFFTKINFNEL